MSFHPTTTNQELDYILKSIKELAAMHQEWSRDYEINYLRGYIKNKTLRNELKIEKFTSECFEFLENKEENIEQ